MSPVYDTDGYLDLSVYDDVDPDVAVSSEVLARLHAAFDAPIPEMPTDAEWGSLVGDALAGADDGPFDPSLDGDADDADDGEDASTPAGPFAVDADPAGNTLVEPDTHDVDAGTEPVPDAAFAPDELAPDGAVDVDVAPADVWTPDPFDDAGVIEDDGTTGEPGGADDLDL